MTSATALDLLDFIAESPSPFHAAEEAANRLRAAGFTDLFEEAEPVPLRPGDKRYLMRGGSIIALLVGTDAPQVAGIRGVGAHTDSPNLRLKPRPDAKKEGWRQLGVEAYGGLIWHSWLDRDLGISGRVITREGDRLVPHLVRVDLPIVRIPDLAIHLNRGVNTEGLKLNPQTHLTPVLGLGQWPGILPWLQDRLGLGEITGFELGFHDVVRPTLGGVDQEFVFSPRLDNLGCCYPAIQAICAAEAARHTMVVALFDHEEIGSNTWSGAAGPFLEQVLSRLVRDATEQAPGGIERMAAHSWMLSADMAHGVHPGYADKHEPEHKPVINGGPVLKVNVNQRYATTDETMARFRAAAEEAGTPTQDFVSRNDQPCGSTIGPISATRMGIRTVDCGGAMLSMHSIREQCGAADVAAMGALMRRWIERS